MKKPPQQKDKEEKKPVGSNNQPDATKSKALEDSKITKQVKESVKASEATPNDISNETVEVNKDEKADDGIKDTDAEEAKNSERDVEKDKGDTDTKDVSPESNRAVNEVARARWVKAINTMIKVSSK